MSPLQQAEALAEAGWPVFPCKEDKSPACRNGFKDAVTSVDGVRWLWRHYPGPLIGVRTGEASGVDALDLDPRHGGHRWWLAHQHLIPQTRFHRTRSGGLHAFFLHTPGVRNTTSLIAPGVDTRGEGGYVIHWGAAGCAVVEAPIVPWPAWLLNELQRRQERQRKPPRAFRPLDTADHAQRVAERVLGGIARAAPGQRYVALRKGSYAIGGLLELLPFGEEEAVARLVRAAMDAGGEDERQAERIARWGLGHGKAAPFALRDDAHAA